MFWFFLSLAFLSRESDWHRNICGGELFFPATSINHKRRAVFIKRKCYHSRLKEPRKRVQEIEPNSPTQWVGDLSSWFTEYKWTFPLQMFLVTTTYLAPVGDFDFLNVFDFLPILVILSWISLNSSVHAAAAAKSLQSCPTLCDPVHGLPPGSPIPGILQARTLEWVAISFSNAWKVKSESEVAQSCLTLCDPMDCSLPGSSVHGIFQARVLEWGAIASSIHPPCHPPNSVWILWPKSWWFYQWNIPVFIHILV